jgi:hypothetical protein
MNTIDYSVPRLCGPCGDVRCSQYGCIKKMFVETPNLVQAQPNITQPYNTNHVAALEMIVKLAGENAVLQKENAELKEKNKALKFEVIKLELNTAAFDEFTNTRLNAAVLGKEK